ncbi:hypothetical protein XELAEV_18027527mg [Xenopus laevis]|uniref:LRRCT domain-containing protein n=1 Tax=Xenopus laevis TaxID=8355 RepID=A0A974CWI8_XENLA|nr:hypothetical protein XELAEV_18027527mg [Xenopus laevis]
MMTFVYLLIATHILFVAACPTLCTCRLKDAVFCQGPSIKDIGSLLLPSNFTYIHIINTLATEITDKSFGNMPITLRLRLEDSRLTFITRDAFKSLPQLKSLKLTNNKLETLPAGVFDSLFYLEQLFIGVNHLSSLHPNLFCCLQHLKELILNRNQLTSLPNELLRNLTELIILNLSRNKISHLPVSIFSSLTKLKKLHLYENQLLTITSSAFNNLGDLLELALYSNSIQSIAPDAFHHLPKLRLLNLSKNKLHFLPYGLFLHLPQLSVLTLYDNPLKELPDVIFGKMENLTSLWLYDTHLATIPNFVFCNLTNLQLLVLTRNPQLESLPADAFSGLSNLLELSLHSNNLSSIDQDLFQNLQQLEKLSLYSNNLKVLSENMFYNLSNLQILALNNSNLHTLPGQIFQELPSLQMVYLHSNPWVCYCDFTDFKTWLQQNQNKVYNPMSLVCDTPLTLSNISVLGTGDFMCQYTTTTENKMDFYTTTTSQTPINTQSTNTYHDTTFTNVKRQFILYNTSPATTTLETTTRKMTDFSETNPTTAMQDLNAGVLKHTPYMSTVPYDKIYFFLYLFNTVLKMFVIFLCCVLLVLMRRLNDYFVGLTEPVVLLRILIPLDPVPQGLRWPFAERSARLARLRTHTN